MNLGLRKILVQKRQRLSAYQGGGSIGRSTAVASNSIGATGLNEIMQANLANSQSLSIASKDRRHIKNLIARREHSVEPVAYTPSRYLYNPGTTEAAVARNMTL